MVFFRNLAANTGRLLVSRIIIGPQKTRVKSKRSKDGCGVQVDDEDI